MANLMKRLLIALLCALTLSLAAVASEQSFIWDNTNTPGRVVGYEVRWGTATQDPTTFDRSQDVPGEGNQRATVELAVGRYWMAVWAYTTVTNPGGEVVKVFSGPSNVLEITIVSAPGSFSIEPAIKLVP